MDENVDLEVMESREKSNVIKNHGEDLLLWEMAGAQASLQVCHGVFL